MKIYPRAVTGWFAAWRWRLVAHAARAEQDLRTAAGAIDWDQAAGKRKKR